MGGSGNGLGAGMGGEAGPKAAAESNVVNPPGVQGGQLVQKYQAVTACTSTPTV